MADYLTPLNTRLDANQVLIRAYDETNNKLRVDAQVTGGSTSVEQQAQTVLLQQIENNTDDLESLTTSLTNIVATETTLLDIKTNTQNTATSVSSVNTKLTSQATATKQDIGNASLSTIASKDFATQAKQVTMESAINTLLKPSDTLASVTTVGAVTSITNTVIIKADTTINQANALKVDGSAVTQPISATALPLPAGASTSANQTTGNGSLASMDTKTPSLGQALATSSVPVVLTAAQLSTLTPLTSVAVSNFPPSQTVAGTVSVSNFPATQAVTGTFFQTTQPISTTSLPLPSGASTETTLSSLNSKVTAVNTGAVVISSSVLPTGAATSVNQSTSNASLSSIDTKIPALGQALAASSSPVVLTAAQVATLTPLSTVNIGNLPATQPVSAVTLPLPTGASTSALQTTTNSSLSSLDTKIPAQGQALATASLPVVLTAVQIATLTPLSTVNVGNFPATQPVSAVVLPLPTGAATSAIQTTMDASINSLLKPASTLAAVTTIGTITNPVKAAGKTSANLPVRNDYTSVSVTTTVFVQLVASTTAATTEIEIFDSSGQTLALAIGAAASEVVQINIFPGGNGRIPLLIPAGSRISIKAISATASSGEININFYA